MDELATAISGMEAAAIAVAVAFGVIMVQVGLIFRVGKKA